jgi:hypothetical protein
MGISADATINSTYAQNYVEHPKKASQYGYTLLFEDHDPKTPQMSFGLTKGETACIKVVAKKLSFC